MACAAKDIPTVDDGISGANIIASAVISDCVSHIPDDQGCTPECMSSVQRKANPAVTALVLRWRSFKAHH